MYGERVQNYLVHVYMNVKILFTSEMIIGVKPDNVSERSPKEKKKPMMC